MSKLKELLGESYGEFKEYFEDVGEIEVGEFYKHDACFATCTLEIDEDVLSGFPELVELTGCEVSQSGTNSYTYGWDSYDEPAVYRRESSNSKGYTEYLEVLAHLNAEENGKALEFGAKYFPDIITLVEVV